MNAPTAFVLTEAAHALNFQALADTLRQRHPALAWQVGPDPGNPNGALVQCGKHAAVLTCIDATMPQDDALWERARVLWRDGRQAAARHRAHFTVSIADANIGEVDRARIATAVAGGLVSSLPDTCAVVWRGLLGRSPQTWLDFSRHSFGPGYPFMLWIDILPFRSVESIGALTVGLSSFTGREIECDLPGLALPDLVGRVGIIASELIGRGDDIKDGEIVALSDTDRIKMHFAVSRFNGSPVLRVGGQPPSGTIKRYPIIPISVAKAHPLLIMLNRVGLFDAASPNNEVELRIEAYESEVRLDSYDQGIQGVLSQMVAGNAYVEADRKARAALASGNTETAKSALLSFAKDIEKFQGAARHALGSGKLFMFLPKQSTTKLS